MLGVFRYEATQGGSTTWDVEWVVAESTGARVAGTTPEGRASNVSVDVEARNLTQVAFDLAWTDDVGSPDTLNLTVVSPEGVRRSAQGDAGELRVVFEGLAATPPPVRMMGQSQQVVERRADEDHASSAGLGRWQVTVTLVDAGDQVAPVGGVVLQADGGNGWTLTPRLTSYHARVTSG